MVAKGAIRIEDALQYAMSLPVATTISGINSVGVLKQNLAIAQAFRPFSPPCGTARSLPPGLGGHCIPIDPFYLTWKAREYGQHTRFIELAGEINTVMPNYVVNQSAAALNQQRKAVNGSRIDPWPGL